MICVDFNNVIFSTISLQFNKEKISEDLLRHMTLNCIRSYRQKYGKDYGELVIICDGSKYWRKERFPYYKAERKKNREESGLDWKTIFDATNKIKDELQEFFPYKFMTVDHAEADDVISVLVDRYSRFEKILILSSDGDFVQLHNNNVKQYDPVRKKWIKESNIEKYMTEHIVKGDRGDGIPNIRSKDDTFVTKSRQSSISHKFLSQFFNSSAHDLYTNGIINEEDYRNYKRNEELIDLSMTPKQIKLNIIEQFENQKPEELNRSKLFNYFIKHRLKNLMTQIQEF